MRLLGKFLLAGGCGLIGIVPSAGLDLAGADVPIIEVDDGYVPPPPPRARDTESACPQREVPANVFADVSRANVHGFSVECLAWWGITQGVTDTEFGPLLQITRGQMADFLVSVISYSATGINMNADDAFDDDQGSMFEGSINALAQVGVIQGVDAATFMPGGPVTRGQMASFITRTWAWISGSPVEAGPEYFDDDSSSPHEGPTNGIAALGLVEGVSYRRFDPDREVTRAQMATFMIRLLDLMVDDNRLVAAPFWAPKCHLPDSQPCRGSQGWQAA